MAGEHLNVSERAAHGWNFSGGAGDEGASPWATGAGDWAV